MMFCFDVLGMKPRASHILAKQTVLLNYITSPIEHIWMCLLTVWISSFVNCLFKLCPLCLPAIFGNLYMSHTRSISDLWFENIFAVCMLSFHCLSGLLKHKNFNFAEFVYHLEVIVLLELLSKNFTWPKIMNWFPVEILYFSFYI